MCVAYCSVTRPRRAGMRFAELTTSTPQPRISSTVRVERGDVGHGAVGESASPPSSCRRQAQQAHRLVAPARVDQPGSASSECDSIWSSACAAHPVRRNEVVRRVAHCAPVGSAARGRPADSDCDDRRRASPSESLRARRGLNRLDGSHATNACTRENRFSVVSRRVFTSYCPAMTLGEYRPSRRKSTTLDASPETLNQIGAGGRRLPPWPHTPDASNACAYGRADVSCRSPKLDGQPRPIAPPPAASRRSARSAPDRCRNSSSNATQRGALHGAALRKCRYHIRSRTQCRDLRPDAGLRSSTSTH